MKVICVALQKGGTGKTSTAVNLAAAIGGRNRKKVLLIDMDMQGNASFCSGLNINELRYSLYNVLTTVFSQKCQMKTAIKHTAHYDVLPSVMKVSDLVNELNEETALRNCLKRLNEGMETNSYDYVIIDTPPSLSILTVNAFVASDYIIVPMEPKPLCYTGLRDLEATIRSVRRKWNPKLKVLGILLIRYNARIKLHKQLKGLIEAEAQQLHTSVFQTYIHDSVIIPESQLAQQSLLDYDITSRPAQDYKYLAMEVLQRIEADTNK